MDPFADLQSAAQWVAAASESWLVLVLTVLFVCGAIVVGLWIAALLWLAARSGED